MSSPQAFLLYPLTSHQDLTHLGDAYAFYSPCSKVSHPSGDIGYRLTGGYGLVEQKTSPRICLFPIKGQHVTRHAQVHTSTPRVGAIDTVDGKIDTVQIFFRGGVYARTGFNFYPHLQGILLGSSS